MESGKRSFTGGWTRGQLHAVGISMVIVCLVAVAFWGLAGGGAQAATITVDVQDGSFVPSIISVNVGDTVTWTNRASVPKHVDGPFFRGTLAPGESYSHTFTEGEVGTHDYLGNTDVSPPVGTLIFSGRVIVHATSTAPAFVDVLPTSPYFTAIEDLADAGTIDGYLRPDGLKEFRSENNLLRAQFTKVLVGALGIPVVPNAPVPFIDVDRDANGYPRDFVAAAYNNHVTQGRTPTLFAPYVPLLRAQASTLQVRALDELYQGILQDPPVDYQNTWGTSFSADHGELARIAEYNGLFAGLPLDTTAADPLAPASRGELAQMMFNMKNLIRDSPPPVLDLFGGQGEFSGVFTVDPTTGNPYHENYGKLAGPTVIPATWDELKALALKIYDANLEDPEWVGTGLFTLYTATGTGTYAGYPNIDFTFAGTITRLKLIGDLTVGADGGLPGGQFVVYHFLGDRINPPPQTAPAFLTDFLDDFVDAKRTNDVGWLFDHLHPAVVDLYGQETCWHALDAEDPDPIYDIDPISISGPADWIYNPDAGTVPVQHVYTVKSNVTWNDGQHMQEQELDLHFGWDDGQVDWFANFGPRP